MLRQQQLPSFYPDALISLVLVRGGAVTLRNKLDITDEVELSHEEERVSKLAALALYRDGTLDTLVPGTFSALKSIHVAL